MRTRTAGVPPRRPDEAWAPGLRPGVDWAGHGARDRRARWYRGPWLDFAAVGVRYGRAGSRWESNAIGQRPRWLRPRRPQRPRRPRLPPRRPHRPGDRAHRADRGGRGSGDSADSADLRHRLAAVGDDAAAPHPRLASADLVRRGDPLPARPRLDRRAPLGPRLRRTASTASGGSRGSPASTPTSRPRSWRAPARRAGPRRTRPTRSSSTSSTSSSPTRSTSTSCATGTTSSRASATDGAIGRRRARRAANGRATSMPRARSGPGCRRSASSSCATRRSSATPEREARRLFEFLGEAWHPAVLDFDPAEHTATERYRRFTASRREAAGESATIYRSRVGAGRAALDPLLRTLLRAGGRRPARRARLR